MSVGYGKASLESATGKRREPKLSSLLVGPLLSGGKPVLQQFVGGTRGPGCGRGKREGFEILNMIELNKQGHLRDAMRIIPRRRKGGCRGGSLRPTLKLRTPGGKEGNKVGGCLRSLNFNEIKGGGGGGGEFGYTLADTYNFRNLTPMFQRRKGPRVKREREDEAEGGT